MDFCTLKEIKKFLADTAFLFFRGLLFLHIVQKLCSELFLKLFLIKPEKVISCQSFFVS